MRSLAVLAGPVWSAPESCARYPYLQNVQADRASILWTTRVPGNGLVTISPASGTPQSVPAAMRTYLPSETGLPSAFFQFQADITGLQSGALYTYRVSLNGQDLVDDATQFRFRTSRPGRFSFLVFGDSGADTTEQNTLVNAMAAERGIAMLVHTGDLVYPKGTFAQYDLSFFGANTANMRQFPVFPTPGNHDYLEDGGAAYRAGLVAPACNVCAEDIGRYYSFDWGDAHFVSLDSNQLPAESAGRMLAWLDQDLSKTRKFWKIVYFHHTPYPTGHHRDDPVCALARERINPIVERHGVQLVLAGHEHGYERTLPLRSHQPVSSGLSTVYVTSGGGGATLHDVGLNQQTAVALPMYHYLRVDVDGAKLNIRAIGLGGSDIDRITLAPEPAITKDAIGSAGDFSPLIARGSLATIFGQNFAPQETFKQDYPVPNELGGVSVTVADIPAPLSYVSPSQINFQVPYNVSGNVVLRVTTPNGSATTNIEVQETAPAILGLLSKGTPVSAEHPVEAGSVITIYATGLGAVSGPISAGEAAPTSPLSPTAQVKVAFGEWPIQPLSVGLLSGYAGVFQVEVMVPSNFWSATYSLRLIAGNAYSGAVPCAVKAKLVP